jgi:EAL domain-containing protein (putative c-di-GMP-specific phosphodiesterase class I)
MSPANRLLILDDDPDVAKTISAVAQKIGFSVKACSEPLLFFETLDTWQPTHIALDLVMPTMDGIEVLERLALLNNTTQIILTSGVGSKVLESARNSALNHGLPLAGILPKPFRPVLLRELLLRPVAKISTARSKNKDYTHSINEFDISRALNNDELEIHYQPKLDLTTKKVAALEALIRWQHPEHGMIYPDVFIPSAERMGQIDQITNWVLRRSFNWFKTLDKSCGIKLEINLSASSLRKARLVEELVELSDECGIDRSSIILEITESSALLDYRIGTDVLTRLRLKGFELAIDDFGTGYSTLTQLANLPFSELKIDKTFILPLLRSSEARKIVESTVTLAAELGITSVAEGVENMETMQFLRRIGCQMAQGYYIAKPMPAEASEQWLASYKSR